MALIYKHALLYEAAMWSLYGSHYRARYEVVADLIRPASTVLDLCCGPAVLFHRHLRQKAVNYIGLDLSAAFIRSLNARGGQGCNWNMHDGESLPAADYVVMQASLYQALPDAAPLIERMLQAARESVIIAEPIRNLSDSGVGWIAALARRLSDPGDGRAASRFTEQSLDALLHAYHSQVRASFLIPGGREKVFVLRGRCTAQAAPLNAGLAEVQHHRMGP